MSCADGPTPAPDTKSAPSKSKLSLPSLQRQSLPGSLPPLPPFFRSASQGTALGPVTLREPETAPLQQSEEEAEEEDIWPPKKPSSISQPDAKEAASRNAKPRSEAWSSTKEAAKNRAVKILRGLAAEEYPQHAEKDIHIMVVLSGSGVEPLACVDDL